MSRQMLTIKALPTAPYGRGLLVLPLLDQFTVQYRDHSREHFPGILTLPYTRSTG